MVDSESILVTCYSGRSYADRPASFVWQGKKYEVKQVEKEWLEPGEIHFVVKTQGRERFELCYHEPKDWWTLTKLEVEQ